MSAQTEYRHDELVIPRWEIWRQRLMRVLLYLTLIIMAIAAMAPFYFMLSGSLMDRGEMFAIPPNLWPKRLIWENYRVIFQEYNFLVYLKNSFIISAAQTLGVLFFCSLAGFIFAKRKFPGRDALFIIILVTATMPQGQATIIPFYLLMIKFDWVNTFWPLIIPWWAPPLSIFLMRQYISSGIHDDLIDASRLDGAGLFQTYWRVVLPLSAPGLVVIGVMQFIAIWNEFLYGLLILRTDDMRTVTVAIAELSTRTRAATLYGPLFAGIVIATIPTILLYFIFQRKLTSGILAGSVRA
ncbi:MAG: carbohydrate ABC transporter permease [Thermomicrobiales bacterium]|nr:carbohydrate ABC transporter permease [Thermomicrobiales bacterium]